MKNHYRIHVDTEALKVRKPAIIVMPENGLPIGQFKHIGLKCSCGNTVATVEQHEQNAHVIVPEYDSIALPPKEEPNE